MSTTKAPNESATCRICPNNSNEITLGYWVGGRYYQTKHPNKKTAKAVAIQMGFKYVFWNHLNVTAPLQ